MPAGKGAISTTQGQGVNTTGYDNKGQEIERAGYDSKKDIYADSSFN